MILLVIIPNNISLNLYSFTILFLSTSQYIKPHSSIAKHCIDKKHIRLYYQLLSYYHFNSYLLLSIIRSYFFYI